MELKKKKKTPSFSSKINGEPRPFGNYIEHSKLLIEHMLFDKFYHSFNFQIIRKPTAIHSIPFNLWIYIKLAFHRSYFQPKIIWVIFTAFADETASSPPWQGALVEQADLKQVEVGEDFDQAFDTLCLKEKEKKERLSGLGTDTALH